jgi:UDP-N-acetylmuramyl pentapeptide phosphotransferase/UDP-N-acetylglucosamine-1-phosphate transferase
VTVGWVGGAGVGVGRRRLVAATTGGVSAVAAAGAVERRSPGADARWQRRNYRGTTVSLSAGPAAVLAAGGAAALGVLLERRQPGSGGAGSAGSLAAAALLAALVAGAAGRYDDLTGERPAERTAKGLRGHAAALRRGQVTGGVVKAAAVGSAAAVAGWLLADADGDSAATRPAGPLLDIAVRAGVVAGTANLVNLLDLRPGRALKAVLVAGAPLVLGRGSGGGLVAGPMGVALALLPGDLAERRMLGDAGANALGAVLGVGWAAGGGRASPGRRIVGLVVLAAVTAASEVVSFSRVIDATPVLRGLDRIGRRPDLGPMA